MLTGALVQATPDPVSILNAISTSPTNTTPANGAPVVGVVFTAPPSGRVLVTFGCDLSITAANSCVQGVRIRTGITIGAGTLIDGGEGADGPNGQRARMVVTGIRVSGGGSFVVTGLTAGTQYNACFYQYVTSGTGTIAYSGLTVMAVL